MADFLNDFLQWQRGQQAGAGGDDIDTVSRQYSVRPELVRAMMQQESGGNQNAVSPKGARGRMQLMPATARELGVDPNDPAQNLEGGVRYMRQMLDRYNGDERLALAAYNAGPGRVRGSVPNIPETQQYVSNITAAAGPQPDFLSQFMAWKAKEPQAEQAPAAPAEQTFAGNLLQSGKNLVGGLAHTVTHPIETADNMLKLGGGVVQLVGPESLKESMGGDYTPYAKAVGQFYKDRYGGWDNIKRTAYEDPIGLLTDASVAIPVLGEVTGAGATALNLSKVARAAELAGQAGRMLDPLQAVSKVGSAALGKTAERIVEFNLKPDKRLQMKNPNLNFGREVLENNISVRPGKAMEQTQAGREASLEKATKMIDTASANGAVASPNDILQATRDEAAASVGQRTPTEAAAYRTAQRAERQLLNSTWGEDVIQHRPVQVQVQVPTGAVDAAGNPIMQTQTVTQMQPVVVGRRLTPQSLNEINDFKYRVQADNSNAYGPLDPRPAASKQVEKAMGAAARRTLEAALPGKKGGLFGWGAEPSLAEVNQRAGTMKVLNKAFKARDAQLRKNFPIGLIETTGLGAAGTALGAMHPALAIPAALGILLKHPTTASPIAHGMYDMSKALPVAAKATTLGNEVNKASTRPLTKAELDARYEALLQRQQ